jgi:multiple sugar transport system substrate-binding protein
MKRRMFPAAVVLAFALLLPAAVAAQSKVVFWYRITASEYEWIRDVVKPKFERENHRIKLEVVHLSGSRAEADQKILVAVAANQQVDVVRTNPEINLMEYVKQGTVIPVDRYVAADKLDLSLYYKPGIDMLTIDGKLYGLPYTTLPRPVMWYVQDAFAGSGVPAPSFNWTTDDWRAAARRLTKDTNGDGKIDVFGTGYATSDVEMEVLANGFGGAFLDPTGTKSLAGLPETLAAMQFLYDMIYQENSAPRPDQLEGGMTQMFGAGRLAMTWGNYWDRAPLEAQIGSKFTWKPNMIPVGPKGRYIQFVSGCLSILRTSRDPAAAFEWLKYYSSEENGKEYIAKGFNPAPRPASNNDPRFRGDSILQAFLPYYDVRPYNLPVWPKNLRRPQYVQIVTNALQRMFVLGEKPAAVLPQLDRDITDLLKQPSL